MSKKVLIVGGVAGGASAAARLRRLNGDFVVIDFSEQYKDKDFSMTMAYQLF